MKFVSGKFLMVGLGTGILAGILATRSEAVVTAGQAVAAKWLGPYQHR